jgi:two-component system, OmpR family, phosphate regulon sensor histidine kinase PhoR
MKAVTADPGQTKFRRSQIFMAVATAALIVATLAAVASSLPSSYFDFTWRWFSGVVLFSILVNTIVLVLLLKRASYYTGAFYWFVGYMIMDIVYLLLVLADVSSTAPAQAAFWQGTWPAGWMAIPLFMLFFTYCYVEDRDMPRNIGLWIFAVLGTFLLQFVAGSTNLLESHVPHNTKLLYWGWQGEPGSDFISVVFLWMFLVMITIMTVLIRAYRRSRNKTTRRQLMLFIVALGQYLLIAVVCDLAIYAVAPDALPPMSFFHFTVLSVLIGYGIFKYGLFQLTPTSLAGPILENLSESVMGVNREYQVEFANEGSTAIFGMDATQLKGRHLQELFRAKDYGRLVKGMESATGQAVFEDLTIKTLSDERMVPVALNIRPALNEHGTRAGYIFVIQNLTDLKRKSVELAREKASVERKVLERTKELHEERARLSASIESLSLGFLLVDPQARPVIQNRALQRILGIAAPAASLADLSKLMSSYDLAKACRQSLDQRMPAAPHEVAIGSKIMRVFITPVILSDGGPDTALGSVVLIEDITEAKVLERSRDEFFSIASHELRTPLTAIRGNTSMMLQYYAGELKDPELVGMINDVHDSSTRLIAIVNDFLDMSRLEQGKMSFELAPFPLEPVVERLAYEMKTVIKEKKLDFRFDTKQLDRLPQLLADKARVQQILYNLVGNSVKFTEKGYISVTTSIEEGDMLKVAVTDSGRGIPVEAHKLLFHKFQQANNSLLTRDTTRGTGLGLYISQLMARTMGGDLGLEKSEPGVGSTFSFRLPLATPERLAKLPKQSATVDTQTGLARKTTPPVDAGSPK